MKVNLERLSGNKCLKAVEPLIREIHKNGKSTVIIEGYSSDDYWWEEAMGTSTYSNVEDACSVWIKSPHPHYPYTHGIALIRNLSSVPIYLYTIKTIEVIKEE